jgi:hypothetical protein
VLRENKPLYGCTIAIIVTMIGCTWSLQESIEDIPEAPDYDDQIKELTESIDSIKESVEAIQAAVEEKREARLTR